MKLILQKDVKNLGKTGDQVFVKRGYARNFLIPRKLALPINKESLRVWKHQTVIIEAKKRKALLERKSLVEKLSAVCLEFEKESMKDGKLFGSVSAFEISQALEKNHNLHVDKRDISFTTLKTIGEHTVSIKLDTEHKTDILVKIKGKITKKRDSDEKDKKVDDKDSVEAVSVDRESKEEASEPISEEKIIEQTENRPSEETASPNLESRPQDESVSMPSEREGQSEEEVFETKTSEEETHKEDLKSESVVSSGEEEQEEDKSSEVAAVSANMEKDQEAPVSEENQPSVPEKEDSSSEDSEENNQTDKKKKFLFF